MVWNKRVGDVLWVFLGLEVSVIEYFLPLGHSVSPHHKVEVSVGDRKCLFIDARPWFALGGGVWGF